MRVLADACQDPGLSKLFASLGSDGGSSGGGDVYRGLAAQVQNSSKLCHLHEFAYICVISVLFVPFHQADARLLHDQKLYFHRPILLQCSRKRDGTSYD